MNEYSITMQDKRFKATLSIIPGSSNMKVTVCYGKSSASKLVKSEEEAVRASETLRGILVRRLGVSE